MKTQISYRVPYADTDQMSVVYYANYLVYFERARNELMREAGFTYFELESLGYMLPIKEAHCDYFSPSHYDDLLTISAWFEELKGARIKISCEVRRSETLIANGYTTHVFVDSAKRKPIRPPKEVIKRFTLQNKTGN